MSRRRSTPKLATLAAVWKLPPVQAQAAEYALVMGADALRRQWSAIVVGRCGRRKRPLPPEILAAVARRAA